MKQTNENGRSMIEMLGVLVIAGLITIGGMAGFRTAMNKMHANNIAEAVGEISMEAQTQNTCLELDDLDDFEKPKCIEFMKASTNGQVKVVFEEGDECDAIKQLTGTSFGRCRWEDAEGYSLFIPNRGYACKEEESDKTGCKTWVSGDYSEENPCFEYTLDSCL